MSNSTFAGRARAAAAGDGTAGAGTYATLGFSSKDATATPPFPRFNLILKSCFSNSNSETEFFFIRSMMALMSFRSTAICVVALLLILNGFLQANQKAAQPQHQKTLDRIPKTVKQEKLANLSLSKRGVFFRIKAI